ncbi:MAG: hypothetical protein KF753_17255 [Caldilineaceae bacterium]|nr:hypothetical protein [Caldilineaceae bacterium]
MKARIFWTLLFLGACIGWVVLSYRPGLTFGRDIVFGPEAGPIFAWLFGGSALLFVGIQLLLVVGVRHFPSRVPGGSGQDNSAGAKDIRLWPVMEYLWTALPLLFSLVLFWAVWTTLLH